MLTAGNLTDSMPMALVWSVDLNLPSAHLMMGLVEMLVLVLVWALAKSLVQVPVLVLALVVGLARGTVPTANP